MICPKEKDVKDFAEEIMKNRKKNGEIPYYIPVGGTNEIGELGYVECIREIIELQSVEKFTHIILPSGSGGTHSGSILGKTYYKSNIKIIGISVKDKKNDQEEKVYNLAKKCCDYIKSNYRYAVNYCIRECYAVNWHMYLKISMNYGNKKLSIMLAIIINMFITPKNNKKSLIYKNS